MFNHVYQCLFWFVILIFSKLEIQNKKKYFIEFRLDSQYLLDKCREPCSQKLNCNDICLGKCGECKQGRIHVPCSEICNKINSCNHMYVICFY